MNTKNIAVLAAASILPLSAFAQTAPPPPVPPVPAVAPIPPVPTRGDSSERLPKVPVTFLGVETSDVPSVVAEQLGLAKGFGLVVDYVTPDGPAAAAGLQPNDILKMLNDQILTEPNQLAKLIRSYNEGTTVTLTVLRKGAETKLSAKLAKKEVPQRRGSWEGRGGGHSENFGDFGPRFEEKMSELGEKLGNLDLGNIDETVAKARAEAERARAQARVEIRRATEEAKRVARNIRVVTSHDNGALKTTRIDLGKAQITYSDGQGEMRIETEDGKKMLTAKDPQGRLLFSGPVTSKEELEKVPAEVRQRYEKLEQKDLPAIAPNASKEENGFEFEMNDNDNDNDDDAEKDDGGSTTHVSLPFLGRASSQNFGINPILI